MLYQTLGQFQVFLWMLAAGAAMGAWYAAMAAVRRLLTAGVLLSACADAAFGLGAAAIYLAALYTANYGQPRLYTVLAAALGFALFAAGVYSPGKKAARTIVITIQKIIVTLRRHRWINVIFK